MLRALRMKNNFAFGRLSIASFLSLISVSTFASECIDEFAGLQKLYSTYENQKSKLWETNRPQAKIYAEASNALRSLVRELGVGSRTDLGESENISFLVLNEEDETKIKKEFQKAISVLNRNTLTQKDTTVITSELEKISLLNLLNKQNSSKFNLEALPCLGGKAYLNYVEVLLENKKIGLSEKTISKFETEKNKDWVKAIIQTVKNEESLWGDTVLEGDVGQNGPAKAAEVSVVYFGKQLILTRIFIQAPAVFTGNGNCEFDDKKNEWVGEDCAEGNISVSKFLDLKNQLIGDDNFADFEN